MEKTCYLCGIPTQDEDFCETCLKFLKEKYPKKRELKKVLQWHKNHTELNQES
ncbi:MAG: hypothetical protein WC548_01235 [Candidatus Pacearchaeota archaeon]